MKKEISCFCLCFSLLISEIVLGQESTLSGTVKGKYTNELLAGVRVWVKDLDIGTITDSLGKFFVEVSSQPFYKVRFSLIGYKSYEEVYSQEVASEPLNIVLVEKTYSSAEILVTAFREKAGVNSVFELAAPKTKIVSVSGDADVVRAMALFPGVIQIDDRQQALSIRGGGSDQTGYFMDDVEIYLPRHYNFGFVTALNMQAIESSTIYTANFPAKYASRASGVLSMKMKEPTEDWDVQTNLGITTASASVAKKWGETSLVAAGRAYHLALLDLFLDPPMNSSFYDANLKITQSFGKGFSLATFGYMSLDRINAYLLAYENPRMNIWGNWMGAVEGNYQDSLQSHKVVISFVNSYSRVEDPEKEELANPPYPLYAINTQQSTQDSLSMNIYDATVRWDSKYRFDESNWTLIYGGEYKFLFVNHSWNNGSNYNLFSGAPDSFYAFSREENFFTNTSIASLYVGGSFNLSDKWLLEASSRFMVSFNDENLSMIFLPRVSTSYRHSDELKFFASAGSNAQFLSQGTEGNGIFGAPVLILYKPLQAWLGTLGGAMNVESFTISAEAYAKYYSTYAELRSERTSTVERANEIKQSGGLLYDYGTGLAYGIDLYIERKLEGFNFQLAYSWMNSWAYINGESLRSASEVEHAAKLNIGWKDWVSGWEFSITGVLASTPPKIVPTEFSIGVEGFTQYKRLPVRNRVYFRTDVEIRKTWRNTWGMISFYFQVFNVFGDILGGIVRGGYQNRNTFDAWEYYTGNSIFGQAVVGTAMNLYPSIGFEMAFF